MTLRKQDLLGKLYDRWISVKSDSLTYSITLQGVAKLPHGTGKKVRVAVFASGADATEALAAGADIVGAEDLVARIQKGEMLFDTVIATPEMMSMVSKIGRILGPRGMMPNPRMGTVTKDVAKAIIAAKKGAVQFRVEKAGIIQVGIGKLSFSNAELLDNIRSFMVAVSDSKPEGLKGKYIEAVSIGSTMGPGVEITTQNVDPSNPKFMLDPTKMGNLK
jgi:large subunit ribosomal protein L1